MLSPNLLFPIFCAKWPLTGHKTGVPVSWNTLWEVMIQTSGGCETWVKTQAWSLKLPGCFFLAIEAKKWSEMSGRGWTSLRWQCPVGEKAREWQLWWLVRVWNQRKWGREGGSNGGREYWIFWCHRFLKRRAEGQEEWVMAYFISKYNSVKRSAL